MAAIGVIRIENESKQAMNTLRLFVIGSTDDLFTDFTSLGEWADSFKT
jgi:hypothetical protein